MLSLRARELISAFWLAGYTEQEVLAEMRKTGPVSLRSINQLRIFYCGLDIQLMLAPMLRGE